MQHPLDADVFVDIRPVDTLARADEAEIRALLGRGFRESPGPSKRDADDAPICETSSDLIGSDLNILDPRIIVSRSVHAMSPESCRVAP